MQPSNVCSTAVQMSEAAWYEREALEQAVTEAASPQAHHYTPQKMQAGDSSLGFVVPPPTAIAHSLIKGWLEAGADASKL